MRWWLNINTHFFLSVENNHELDEEKPDGSLEENDTSDNVNSDSMDENDFGTLLVNLLKTNPCPHLDALP